MKSYPPASEGAPSFEQGRRTGNEQYTGMEVNNKYKLSTLHIQCGGGRRRRRRNSALAGVCTGPDRELGATISRRSSKTDV